MSGVVLKNDAIGEIDLAPFDVLLPEMADLLEGVQTDLTLGDALFVEGDLSVGSGVSATFGVTGAQVTPPFIMPGLASPATRELTQLTLNDGVSPQGAPASPSVIYAPEAILDIGALQIGDDFAGAVEVEGAGFSPEEFAAINGGAPVSQIEAQTIEVGSAQARGALTLVDGATAQGDVTVNETAPGGEGNRLSITDSTLTGDVTVKAGGALVSDNGSVDGSVRVEGELQIAEGARFDATGRVDIVAEGTLSSEIGSVIGAELVRFGPLAELDGAALRFREDTPSISRVEGDVVVEGGFFGVYAEERGGTTIDGDLDIVEGGRVDLNGGSFQDSALLALGPDRMTVEGDVTIGGDHLGASSFSTNSILRVLDDARLTVTGDVVVARDLVARDFGSLQLTRITDLADLDAPRPTLTADRVIGNVTCRRCEINALNIGGGTLSLEGGLLNGSVGTTGAVFVDPLLTGFLDGAAVMALPPTTVNGRVDLFADSTGVPSSLGGFQSTTRLIIREGLTLDVRDGVSVQSGLTRDGAPLFDNETLFGPSIQIDTDATLVAPQVLIGSEAVLFGDGGSIIGDVIVGGGLVAPGASPGSMLIDGDFSLLDGVLAFEIAGLGAGEFDQLAVTGDFFAEPGFTLKLDAIDGFSLDDLDVWTFLTVDGAFDADLALANILVNGQAMSDRFALRKDGGSLSLAAAGVNVAPVPLPAGAWLLLSALTAGGLFARTGGSRGRTAKSGASTSGGQRLARPALAAQTGFGASA